MINWEDFYTHEFNVKVRGQNYNIIIQTCEINEDTIEDLMESFNYGSNGYYEDGEYIEEELDYGMRFTVAYANGDLIDYAIGYGTDLTGFAVAKWIKDMGGEYQMSTDAERLFMLNDWEYTHEKY